MSKSVTELIAAVLGGRGEDECGVAAAHLAKVVRVVRHLKTKVDGVVKRLLEVEGGVNRANLVDLLGLIDPGLNRTITIVGEALRTGDRRDKFRAIRALMLIGRRHEQVEPLLAATRESDEDSHIRAEAEGALRYLGLPEEMSQ